MTKCLLTPLLLAELHNTVHNIVMTTRQLNYIMRAAWDVH